MEYIDKNLAMEYLMGNTTIFNKIKNSFLESYKNYEEDYMKLVEAYDFSGLEIYIHSLKGISLNLGARVLYDRAIEALDPIRKKLWNAEVINSFIIALRGTYQELNSLQYE